LSAYIASVLQPREERSLKQFKKVIGSMPDFVMPDDTDLLPLDDVEFDES
ncbi:MAG: hypothetical protein JNG84_00685, partial [Archangium sp.]|nr:hypothetical protein [Archangium sp.]